MAYVAGYWDGYVIVYDPTTGYILYVFGPDVDPPWQRAERAPAMCRGLCFADVGSGAGHVGAFGGVDADFFAFVDERRDLDDEAGFGGGGLGDGAGGGGLDAGLGLDDGHLDDGGELDADGLAVVEGDGDEQVGREVFDGVAEGVALEVVCS